LSESGFSGLKDEQNKKNAVIAGLTRNPLQNGTSSLRAERSNPEKHQAP